MTHHDGPVRTINWHRIESFIGFGRRDAPFVFVGLEEGLGAPDALLEELAIRSTYDTPVMDLKESFRGSEDGERYFDPDHAPIQPTWRVMADLMVRHAGTLHPTKDDRRHYRTLRLGRSDGETLLTELLPYPHTRTSEWLYGRFSRYPTRALYESDVLPKRKELLRDVLAESPRKLIVCYGKARWPDFAEIFGNVRWDERGIHRVGFWNDTRVVLTTHLSTHDFATDEQLADFARVALGTA